ncbi:MAG: hypothetical protein K2P49_10595, partial [Oscillospiraceae bacterium]|nr:hypothetical protein [Oscillospiraceae bacterium]
MTESIKRDEAIRLNNGRIYTLDAAKIGTNEYEVMLFNPRTGEEIDSAKTSTEADAILQFDRLRRMYHRPAPAADAPVVLKGRYKCQRQAENVDFRRNRMSFFGGQHSSV